MTGSARDKGEGDLGKTYKLLGQGNLVELHLVDAGIGSANQRGGCDHRCAFHGDSDDSSDDMGGKD